MVADVFAGLSAFKTMMDSAAQVLKIRDDRARLEASIDLLNQLNTAHQGYSALAKEKELLEAEVLKLKDMKAELSRYELKQLPPGTLVYALKETDQRGEPSHYICPTCYQRGKKSLLQEGEKINGQTPLKCHECATELRAGIYNAPSLRRGGAWSI